MASSASWSGIPLTYPNQTIATNPNYMMGMGDQAGSPVNSGGGGLTPAGGLFYGASGGAQGLYNFGQQGAGSEFNNALASAQGNAGAMQGIAGGLNGATAGNLSYATQALKDAFDPQQQAYNYYRTQALSAAGAQEAQQGIANTPYGSEVTGATDAAFGNNWRTAQIGRESTGAATATGLQNQYLGQQQSAASIYDQAGNLDLGAASQLLTQYGLQGSQMQAALGIMAQLFGDMKSSGSGSGGGVEGGLQNMVGIPQGLS